MVVQNNLNSLNAYDKLNVNVTGLKKSSEKLSSGYRINRAGDDAAGLAVSEKMRSQLKGLTQGVKNMQDGINLLQTADGALSTVHDMIHRLGELSEQAANGSYSLIERESIQQEVNEILKEIDQTSDYVVFNNKSVFGGSGGEGKTATAVSAAVSDATAAVTSENTPQPTTRSTLERNNAAMSALVADAPEETDFTPLMAMNENVLKVRSYAAAAPRAASAALGGFIVTGGTEGVDYRLDSVDGINQLTILTDTVLEISTNSVEVGGCIYVEKDINANITLNNTNIKSQNWEDPAAFIIADDSKGNVNLTLKGNNILNSRSTQGAALQKNGGKDSGTLTIDGSGSLTATGGFYSAGIGSCGPSGSANNITIRGGTVTATGGSESAGIGGGAYADVSNITISGGTVTATGGGGGAGIGGGAYGDVSNITISGGTVIATGTKEDGYSTVWGAGIGGGYDGRASNITINGGTVTAIGAGESAGIGGEKDITISAGKVTAIGGDSGAGIGGGNVNNITISGGEVTATGGMNSAGIGGSSGRYGESVTGIIISGGTVTATGGENHAGIGSKDAQNIEINGGKVTATGGKDGSGIEGSDITVEKGEITAIGIGIGSGIGGNQFVINDGTIIAHSEGDGAGIGSNYIDINGGTVNAHSEGDGAGIGSAKDSSSSGQINITGGSVTALSKGDGAGIGGGSQTYGTGVHIYGGTVTAQSNGNGAGIGGGSNGGDARVHIDGGTITAQSNGDGAGIGGGLGARSEITVITGKITAESAGGGAGMGGGAGGDGLVDLSNGYGIVVTATSKDGAGIGGGKGAQGQATIYNASVTAKSVNGAGIGNGSGYTGSSLNTFVSDRRAAVYAVSENGDNFSNLIRGESYLSGLVIEGKKGYTYGGNSETTIENDFTVESGVWAYVDGKRAFPFTLSVGNNTTLTNNGVIYFTLRCRLNVDGTLVNNGKIIFEYETEDEKKEIEESVKGVGGTIEYVKVDSGNPPEIPGPDPDPPGPDNPDPPNPPDPPGPDKPDPPGPGKPDKPGGNTPGGSNGTGSGSGYGSDGGVTEWQSVWRLQVGARTKDTMFVEIGAMNTRILGIDGLDVTDQENANRAIDLTSAALNKISAMRSTIGAQQNRLEHKLSNTVNVKENLTGSESAIRDADMAEEVLNNTKYKILLQASQIILMQSNEVPRSALQLLG